MDFPECFCWTRYGTEAGETIETIISRKEIERTSNLGLFLWGIGNSLGPSISLLISTVERPKVVFSPILSAPRRVDVNPAVVVKWLEARTLDGQRYEIPWGSVVKSRLSAGGRHKRHYALVCSSGARLELNQRGPMIPRSDLINLSTGRPVAASQVTAVVRRKTGPEPHGPLYRATMMVDLIWPYLLKLCRPEPLAGGGGFTLAA